MDVKDMLKSRRIELGLTQDDVARYVGVSETTVSRWESGDIDNMKRNRIALLAQILQISPISIMGWGTDDDFRIDLTKDENSLLHAYRHAEPQAREYALDMLLSHPQKNGQENHG